MVTQFTTTAGVLVDGVLFLNGTIDLNGVANSFILDADGDTHISSPTDDQIDISLNGADDFTITPNSFNILSGSFISGPSSTIVPLMPLSSQQSLTGGGAVNISSYYTAWTTTSADAATLANGNVKGQLKKITLVANGGDGTLTPTSLSGGTTITFNDAGDYVILLWNGSAWVVIENVGTTIA